MVRSLRDLALKTETNSTDSFSGPARARRWARFIQEFPDVEQMRVLDLGGTPASWVMAPFKPAAVTTVNMAAMEADDPTVTAIQGDACELPASLRGERFDLVYSNSLLEHVGGHVPRQRLADNIHTMANKHWVQTPYRYFPIEPHWLFPGIQWLPYSARIAVSLRWNRGPIQTYTRAQAEKQVNEIDLIGIEQMRMYFPDSRIWYERFAGLIKSVVAIKDSTPSNKSETRWRTKGSNQLGETPGNSAIRDQ
jgi:hypothetical protein